jgi:hypothetical protein
MATSTANYATHSTVTSATLAVERVITILSSHMG